MSKGGKLLIFSAPSGSGKTTIVRYLLEQPELNLAFSVSATSRPRRGNEKHGEHYYFMSISEFKNHIKKNDFLEWEEVYRDNFYGTLKSEVERLWAKGKNEIFDIDVAGGLRIKKKHPIKTLAVFVKPPSVDELKIRLKKLNPPLGGKVICAYVELESSSGGGGKSKSGSPRFQDEDDDFDDDFDTDLLDFM